MHASTLKPRKTPRQLRSLAMVDVILQAATRVLERESLAGFTTNRVAEVAGISVGSLYQYFPNKDALVAELITRDQQARVEAIELLGAGLRGLGLLEAIEAMAAYAVQQQYGKPLLAAALDHEERRLPVRALVLESERRIAVTIAAWLEPHRAQLSDTLPPETVRDCLTITKALVEADMERGLKPSANLQARVVRALVGYLGIAGTATPSAARRRTDRAR